MTDKHIFTQEDIDYIIANHHTKTYEEIGKHIGVKLHSIRKKISWIRKNGYKLEHRTTVPIGTITERKDRGGLSKFIKTENGWRRMKVEKKHKLPLKATKFHKETPKKITQAISIKIPMTKKVIEKPIRREKQEQIPIRIPELKMIVYVSKNSNPEEVKKKYFDHYQFMSKTFVGI